jgi:hypothetical protein
VMNPVRVCERETPWGAWKPHEYQWHETRSQGSGEDQTPAGLKKAERGCLFRCGNRAATSVARRLAELRVLEGWRTSWEEPCFCRVATGWVSVGGDKPVRGMNRRKQLLRGRRGPKYLEGEQRKL